MPSTFGRVPAYIKSRGDAFGPEHLTECPALLIFEVFATLSGRVQGANASDYGFLHPSTATVTVRAPYQLTCQGVPLTLKPDLGHGSLKMAAQRRPVLHATALH
jgi:hypothetical protein